MVRCLYSVHYNDPGLFSQKIIIAFSYYRRFSGVSLYDGQFQGTNCTYTADDLPIPFHFLVPPGLNRVLLGLCWDLPRLTAPHMISGLETPRFKAVANILSDFTQHFKENESLCQLVRFIPDYPECYRYRQGFYPFFYTVLQLRFTGVAKPGGGSGALRVTCQSYYMLMR